MPNSVIDTLQAMQVPTRMKPGEVLLFIDLSRVANPSAVLARSLQEGYEPKLGIQTWKTGACLVAVLKQGEDVDRDRYQEWLAEWQPLSHRLLPDNPRAVRLLRGMYPEELTLAS